MPETYPLVQRWPIAPGIRLDGDFLIYDRLPRDPRKLRFTRQANSRLLYNFVGLAEASAAQIEVYAKQWGALGLCRHGEPTAVAYAFHGEGLPPGHWICRETRREPLERWRALAGAFGGHVDNVDRFRTDARTRRYMAASTVTAHINHFAATFGHLRPVVVQVGNGFALRIAGSLAVAGLAAALAYHLMVAATGGNGWLVCAECGRWFQPNTRRSPNRKAYCPKCGRAAAVRAASREYYKRKRQR